MNLAFETKLLRELCENSAKADRKLGAAVGRKLRQRLADLEAATTIKDLVASPPILTAQDQMAIELVDGYRIIFTANHVNNPLLKSGMIKWSAIERIKIMRIEQS